MPIIVICGATATGKTALAVAAAQAFGGEVVNADSMQVYSGMDIATAMPTESERAGAAHHLFGIVSPERRFSVAEWLNLARGKIAEIHGRGAVPIIVGGTGLYISSLVDNVIFDDVSSDAAFREQMFALARECGNEVLHEKLRQIDPEAASRLHMNNVNRIVRILEIHEHCGETSAERTARSRAKCSPFETCMFNLEFEDRQLLYERINVRVDGMVMNGLVEEARGRLETLKRSDRLTSAQAIGHKELLPYLSGETDLETCIENVKMKTRNYAKRQMTWFRRFKCINKIYVNDFTQNVHVLQKTSDVLCSKNFLKKY
ncbi:MAG: tRNA (adenosine(37)-N6)-dimethylallyltransferase MiaA [Oscillospiraceae bacterium]|nr:tRNA (adenosine(37)-N6)-dimethylallyltransferase MiaA [Oscillospiraceae bacterium]